MWAKRGVFLGRGVGKEGFFFSFLVGDEVSEGY